MSRLAVLPRLLVGVFFGASLVAGQAALAEQGDPAQLLMAANGSNGSPAGNAAPERPAAIVFGRALNIEGTPLRLRRTAASAGVPGQGMFSYKGPFARPTGLPVRATSISSAYGMRWHPLTGGNRFHAGLDFPAPSGTPVQATAAGVVTFAGWNGGYGLCVTVDHGDGYMTLFGHLSTINTEPGTIVSSGTVVGRVGSTGQSTGPHLHYEVRREGRPVDPRGYL